LKKAFQPWISLQKKIELIHLPIDESKESVLSEIEAILLHSLSRLRSFQA